MKKYFFNDDWKNWIWSNINNGIKKQRIYDDLIANDYDVFTYPFSTLRAAEPHSRLRGENRVSPLNNYPIA